MKLSNLSAVIYFYCVLSVSPASIFLSTVSRTWYPLIPDLAMYFTYHIHHFSFSTLKGIIWIVFFPILVTSCIYCHLSPQSSGLLIVLQSMSEGSDNLSASSAIYTLKCSDVCFNFCSFTDYDQVILPPHPLFYQVLPIIILSPSILELFSSLS